MAGIVPAESVGPTLLAVTSAVSAFTTFLPPLSTVRRATADDPEFAADVRMGELAAALLTMGVGATASAVIGSGVPFAISLFAAAALVALYEYTLQGKPFSGHNPVSLRSVPTVRSI